MKAIKLSVLILPLLIFFPKLANAQQMMQFDASTSLMLQEFQAMLTFEDDQVQVRMKLGRNEAKEGTDQLEQGDVILMMNGKRATDIETLRAIYEGIEPDQEIKVGIRRGNERFILNAIKGDGPEGGQRMMMSFDTEGDGPPPAIVPELGALLAERDGSVFIQRVIPPMQPEELKAFEIEGYTIKELNGEQPESTDQLRKDLEALEIGAEISITLEKDGDEKSIVFTKQEPRGSFRISTSNN
ncbi:MAG: hypothetical protein ACMZ7B_08715 [Balneola sp.]